MCTSSYIKSILVSVFCRHARASIGGHRFVLIAWFVEVRFFLLYLYILFSRPTIFRSKLIACTISYVPFFFILFVFILFLATVAQHTNYDFLWKKKNWIKWFKKKMGAAIKKKHFRRRSNVQSLCRARRKSQMDNFSHRFYFIRANALYMVFCLNARAFSGNHILILYERNKKKRIMQIILFI